MFTFSNTTFSFFIDSTGGTVKVSGLGKESLAEAHLVQGIKIADLSFSGN